MNRRSFITTCVSAAVAVATKLPAITPAIYQWNEMGCLMPPITAQ